MNGLDVLFAAEYLLPPIGGAELFALELLEALAGRGHRVRAVHVGGSGAPPPGVDSIAAPVPATGDGYWHSKRIRREAVGTAVEAALADRPADVVLTQLHAAPAAVSAGASAGAATVLSLPSYESLCKHAFDPLGGCGPARDCRTCPAAVALPPHERTELLRSRGEHARALVAADALLAPSRAVAAATEAWCGRRPAVAHPVAVAPPPARAERGGFVAAIARWSRFKGEGLLEPLARGLADRRFRVAAGGLSPESRSRLAAAPNVELVPQAPLPELIEGAAVVIVPSQGEEAFARVAFEALGAGIPVLASVAGGLPEHVPPELLVRPRDDVGAWIGAVRALEDPARWEAAREAGLSAARSTLRSDPVGRTERVLLEAARGRTPRRARARTH